MPGGKQQVMLNAIVAELDRTKIENQGIDISAALAKAGISLASLPGAVASSIWAYVAAYGWDQRGPRRRSSGRSDCCRCCSRAR